MIIHWRRRIVIRHRVQAGRLELEALERRYPLSANINLDPLSGVVTILGSPLGDQAIVEAADSSTIRVSLNSTEVELFPSSSVQLIYFLGRAGDDLFQNQTNVPVKGMGGEGNDHLIGGGAIDRLYGDGGNDILDGQGEDDLLYGGTGNDRLTGGLEGDQLLGGDGNDILSGGLGDDFLYGLAGNDTLKGESGRDTIRGGSGDDVVYGGEHDDWLFGDEGSDTMYGESGNDSINGGDQDDVVNGGAGDDKIRGDAGSDHLNGSSGNDLIWGGFGSDEIWGAEGNDVLSGGAEADLIRGGLGNDILYGDDGDDRLLGDWGADKIFGGNGDDRIYGGAASIDDVLYGNLGQDRFLLEGNDVVVDWSNQDAKLYFVRGDTQWNAAEIEVFDEAFQMLYEQTGNNRLLRDSLDPTGIKFVKYAWLPGGTVSINRLTGRTTNGQTTYTRVIDVKDWNEANPSYNSMVVSAVVHEIGHNWDSSKEIGTAASSLQSVWTAFLKQSGWIQTQPANLAFYNRSSDGRWWYLKSAEFARDYGRANPFEDWSTVWERCTLQPDQTAGPSLQGKLAAVESLFNSFARLG